MAPQRSFAARLSQRYWHVPAPLHRHRLTAFRSRLSSAHGNDSRTCSQRKNRRGRAHRSSGGKRGRAGSSRSGRDVGRRTRRARSSLARGDPERASGPHDRCGGRSCRARRERLKVQFERQALTQIRAAHQWWIANRFAAPQLFAQEIAHVVRKLRRGERVGVEYVSSVVGDVRRVLCPRTRYHVYYMVDEPRDTAIILAIWSGVKQHGPSLRQP